MSGEVIQKKNTSNGRVSTCIAFGSIYQYTRNSTYSHVNLIKKKDSSDDDINISLYSEITSYFSTADLDLSCAENVHGKMWVKCNLDTSFKSTE